MPYNVPALRKLITDGEKDIAFELGLQRLPPVGVEKALNTSFSNQVRDLYDHQSWIKDQIIPSVKSDDETIIETAASEGVIRKQATFATGPAVFKGEYTVAGRYGDANRYRYCLCRNDFRRFCRWGHDCNHSGQRCRVVRKPSGR